MRKLKFVIPKKSSVLFEEGFEYNVFTKNSTGKQFIIDDENELYELNENNIKLFEVIE